MVTEANQQRVQSLMRGGHPSHLFLGTGPWSHEHRGYLEGMDAGGDGYFDWLEQIMGTKPALNSTGYSIDVNGDALRCVHGRALAHVQAKLSIL